MAEISVLFCPDRQTDCTEALSLSSDSNLLEAFFNYISTTEKDVLTEALSNFKGADMDELLSFLSSHDCCVLPTEHNLQSLIEEIAHKEMVQEPAFQCWKPILRSIGQSMSTIELKKTLDDLKSKARNVTKCKFPGCMSLEQQTTSNHLLRFVRERDEKELGLFLRYCTGSDLFLFSSLFSIHDLLFKSNIQAISTPGTGLSSIPHSVSNSFPTSFQ